LILSKNYTRTNDESNDAARLLSGKIALFDLLAKGTSAARQGALLLLSFLDYFAVGER